MNRSLYVSKKTELPNLEIFQKKTGLKTGVGTAIFLQFIATRLGDHLDFKVPQNEGKQTPAVP